MSKRVSILALLFLSWSSMTFCDELLTDINWHFAEGEKLSYEGFIKSLVEYNGELETTLPAGFHEQRLQFDKVTIEFDFWVEKPGSGWEEFTASMILESEQERFTVGELLFQIHHGVWPYLKDADRSYFEGLALIEDDGGQEVPAYELLLGS